MKKCMIYFFIVIMCLVLGGCANNEYSKLKNNLGEIRYNVFTSSNEYVKCTYMSGKREKDYSCDGQASSLVNFGVFYLTFLDNSAINLNEIEFTATINGHQYSGSLEKSPYEKYAYASDVGLVVKNNAQIKLFYVVGDNGRDLSFSCKNNEWKLDCYDALKIASKELQSFTKECKTNNLSYEVYVKIACDQTEELLPYYWLVQIINQKGDMSQVVIDPIQSEILVKTNAI